MVRVRRSVKFKKWLPITLHNAPYIISYTFRVRFSSRSIFPERLRFFSIRIARRDATVFVRGVHVTDTPV